MSFSTEVKDQLARIITNKICCKQIEFVAFLRMSGNINLGAGGKVGISASTSNPAIARRYFKLAKEVWGLQAEILVSKNNRLKKNNLFTLRIPPQAPIAEILEIFAKIPDGNPWTAGKNPEAQPEQKPIFFGDCCYRAYLRGAFLGNGFINHPQKAYHLEMVCQNLFHAQFIIALMRMYEMQGKINQRKGSMVVYLKESEQISIFLNVIGAHNALLELENIKIFKEQVNLANRKANCDEANADKIAGAGVRQNQAIQKIAAAIGLQKLPLGLREVALLRQEMPDVALKELGQLLSPPLSKSGINHRLRKLEKIAEELEETKE